MIARDYPPCEALTLLRGPVMVAKRRESREADLPGPPTEPGQAVAGTGFKLRDEVAAMIARDYQLYEALTLLRGPVMVAKRRESRDRLLPAPASSCAMKPPQ